MTPLDDLFNTKAPFNLSKITMKTLDNDYKLISMSEITDEARQIAVRWVENYSPTSALEIQSKHKLASDIMNYARRYAQSQAKQFSISDSEIEKAFQAGYNRCLWNVDRLEEEPPTLEDYKSRLTENLIIAHRQNTNNMKTEKPTMNFFNEYAIANNEMHPLAKLFFDAMQECEKLPASEQQTATVISIGKCKDAVEEMLQGDADVEGAISDFISDTNGEVDSYFLALNLKEQFAICCKQPLPSPPKI